MNDTNDIVDKKEELGMLCYNLHYSGSGIMLFENGFGLVGNIYCKL